MSLMDMDALTAAFKSHTEGNSKFTRRMAIALSGMDGTTPRQLVLRCERLGLLRPGSWDWFVANGGITPEQIQEVREASQLTRHERVSPSAGDASVPAQSQSE